LLTAPHDPPLSAPEPRSAPGRVLPSKPGSVSASGEGHGHERLARGLEGDQRAEQIALDQATTGDGQRRERSTQRKQAAFTKLTRRASEIRSADRSAGLLLVGAAGLRESHLVRAELFGLGIPVAS
jgi:hypothetical protein